MYELKTNDVYEDFSKDKKLFCFSHYSVESKYYDDSKKLVVGQLKYETGSVTIKEFFGFKPKMY